MEKIFVYSLTDYSFSYTVFVTLKKYNVIVLVFSLIYNVPNNSYDFSSNLLNFQSIYYYHLITKYYYNNHVFGITSINLFVNRLYSEN